MPLHKLQSRLLKNRNDLHQSIIEDTPVNFKSVVLPYLEELNYPDMSLET